MDCVVTPLKTLMGFSVHLNVQLKFYNLPKEARQGDISKSRADVSKLKGIGFKPQWSLHDGLTNYWKYYSEK
ncbi:hypothetical protein EFT48_08600 [Limosilactobacillus fermentum]|nr:hypothetical protein [Limosilactobacillus fermentum]